MFGALKRGFRSMASLILLRNVVGELRPKRTLAASRGFLAAARLSCCLGFLFFSVVIVFILGCFAPVRRLAGSKIDSEVTCIACPVMCRVTGGTLNPTNSTHLNSLDEDVLCNIRPQLCNELLHYSAVNVYVMVPRRFDDD